MPTYLSPGVYVEEVSSGSKPIEGVGTAVAAFVGFAETRTGERTDAGHELDAVHDQLRRVHAGLVPRTRRVRVLPQRRGHRLRRPRRCGRRRRRRAKPARAELLPAPAEGGNAQKGYAIEALEGGSAGDQISVEVADASEPSDDNFKLIVKQNGREAEVYDNVTTRKGANNVVTKVKAESKLISIEETKGSGAVAVPPKGSFALSGGEAPSARRSTCGPTTTSATPRTAPGSPASKASTK